MDRQRGIGLVSTGSNQNRPVFVPNLATGGTGIDLVSGVAPATSISGTRYGIVNGIVTQFAVNQSPIEDDGLRGCPAFTQYFLNNETPVTQSITLAAGSYCLWVEGSGSATFNGLTSTAGVPKVFTLASGFTGNCVITGSVTKIMLNSGLFPAPFSTTEGVTKSFVSEAATASTGTSFDLDNALLARLKNVLRGPSAQGHIDIKIKTMFNTSWYSLLPTTHINFFSVGDIGFRGLSYRVSSDGLIHWKAQDSVNGQATIIDSNVTLGSEYLISIDFGTHSTGQKLRLTVNGVKSTLVNFTGSFGTQDLRFFFGNTVHAGWIGKDSLKVSDRPQW